MFAVARDETSLGYEIIGNPAAPGRIALVHSLAMDRSFWSSVVAELGGEAAILTVDCRGHGVSGKPPGPYTAELFADDLADVFAHAGWEKAVVAGASMGGCVSLAFAARHPARVSGLGLFDTTAWYGADAPKAWEERASKALEEGLNGLVAFQKTRWFSDAFRERRPEVVDACIDVFLRNEPQAYAATCRMLGAADLRPHLGDIAVPVRIVVGSEDYATPPAMAQALHAAIPGSAYRLVEGARHLSPLEIPAIIAEELRALL